MKAKLMLKIISCLVLCCAVQVSVWGQAKGPDKVYLQDGNVVQGWIESYETGKELKIKIKDGQWAVILAEDIARIVSDPGDDNSGIRPGRLRDVPFTLRKDLDIVYLKNGEAYAGLIKEFENGKLLSLETSKGEDMVFADYEIDRIIYGNRKADRAAIRKNRAIARGKEAVYAFRERGVFHYSNLSFSFGESDAAPEQIGFFPPNRVNRTNLETGYGFQHISGYQWNRLLGLGLSLSYDSYSLNRNERVFGLAGHYRAYLNAQRFAPVVSMDAGYGFALKSKRSNVSEAEGGLLVHPAIGLRCGANEGVNLVVDFGLRFQQATYTRLIPEIGSTEIREVTFRRWLFRLGLVF